MDVRFINAFTDAIGTVFKTMLSVETVIGKPFVKTQDDSFDADVYAMIGLSGDTSGMVVLSFPDKTGLKVASSLSGETMKLDHPDFGDALGEVINMIAGHAKAQFEGLSTNISLPKVILGKTLNSTPSKDPTLILPCDSTMGRFRLEVSMRSNTKSAA